MYAPSTPSEGFDRKWVKIPYQRLAPEDFFNMLDWIKDGWTDDEIFVTPRLQRLKWHLEELPEQYRTPALEQYDTVTRARIVADVPWSAALAAIRLIVSKWGRSREGWRPST